MVDDWDPSDEMFDSWDSAREAEDSRRELTESKVLAALDQWANSHATKPHDEATLTTTARRLMSYEISGLFKGKNETEWAEWNAARDPHMAKIAKLAESFADEVECLHPKSRKVLSDRGIEQKAFDELPDQLRNVARVAGKLMRMNRKGRPRSDASKISEELTTFFEEITGHKPGFSNRDLTDYAVQETPDWQPVGDFADLVKMVFKAMGIPESKAGWRTRDASRKFKGSA